MDTTITNINYYYDYHYHDSYHYHYHDHDSYHYHYHNHDSYHDHDHDHDSYHYHYHYHYHDYYDNLVIQTMLAQVCIFLSIKMNVPLIIIIIILLLLLLLLHIEKLNFAFLKKVTKKPLRQEY